jgi:hypothetical protein
MQHSLKALVRIIVCLALILTFAIGCSTPTYMHTITHHYDANGKLVSIDETEGISQPSPSSSPMKVKIDYPTKIEK